MAAKKTKTELAIEKAVRLLERHGWLLQPPASPVELSDKEVAEKKLQVRRDAFIEELRPYVNIYGREMTNDFYKYWSEPNRSLTKMKFEMQQTWDLKLRLETWNRNNKKRNGTDYKEQQRQQRLRDSAELFAKYTGTDSGTEE